MLGWDLNQACVQMATANYCLDGKAHTREKTPILIRDFIPSAEPPNSGITQLQHTPGNYPPVPPPPDNYYFEAAWAPRQPVLCLNKLRWNDQLPGGPCPKLLKDPRVEQTARYCEENPPDLGSHDLLNASMTMDLALHRWSNGAGDTVTTAHGFVVDTNSHRVIEPPLGFRAPPLSDEGFLLRNRTGTIDPGEVIPVYRLRNIATGDSVLGPASMLPGYTFTDPDAFEGYLFTAGGPGKQAFYLYRSGNDYVTATARPDPTYEQIGGPTARPIGYVVAEPL
jgi:hypothetical protein